MNKQTKIGVVMPRKQNRYKVTIILNNDDEEVYYVPGADPDGALSFFEDDSFNIKKIVSVEEMKDEHEV